MVTMVSTKTTMDAHPYILRHFFTCPFYDIDSGFFLKSWTVVSKTRLSAYPHKETWGTLKSELRGGYSKGSRQEIITRLPNFSQKGIIGPFFPKYEGSSHREWCLLSRHVGRFFFSRTYVYNVWLRREFGSNKMGLLPTQRGWFWNPLSSAAVWVATQQLRSKCCSSFLVRICGKSSFWNHSSWFWKESRIRDVIKGISEEKSGDEGVSVRRRFSWIYRFEWM